MISGDNDVGGEGIDFKQQWKVNRFKKYFDVLSSGDVANVKNIDFFKVFLLESFLCLWLVYFLYIFTCNSENVNLGFHVQYCRSQFISI